MVMMMMMMENYTGLSIRMALPAIQLFVAHNNYLLNRRWGFTEVLL